MSRPTANSTNPFGPPSPPTVGIAAEAVIPTNPFDALEGQTYLDNIPLSPYRDIIPTDNNEKTDYKYNTNHSRGAITLNDYDFARKGSRLHYDYKKVDAELPKYILWFRKALYVAQMLIIVGGIVMGGGAYIAENNGWEFSPNGLIFGHMERELIYVPYAGAFMCLITGVVGFVGTKTQKRCGKVMLIVYIVCVGICLIFSIASATQAFADLGNRFHYGERQWNALTGVEEQTFEYWNYCCNYDTIEPCCRFAYGVTDCMNELFCFEVVEPHLIQQFTIIGVTAMLQTANLMFILVCAVVLFIYWTYKTAKKKKIEEEEEKAAMERKREEMGRVYNIN